MFIKNLHTIISCLSYINVSVQVHCNCIDPSHLNGVNSLFSYDFYEIGAGIKYKDFMCMIIRYIDIVVRSYNNTKWFTKIVTTPFVDLDDIFKAQK
jgi:hypothetical protein